MKNDLEDKIKKLHLDEDIENILLKNGIDSINKLYILKRKNLKDMGFNDNKINHIIIKLQLQGFDLNKKVYNKI